MRRSPGFTAVIFLSLALGIGANTAVFSLINTLMLRELPYVEAARAIGCRNGRIVLRGLAELPVTLS